MFHLGVYLDYALRRHHGYIYPTYRLTRPTELFIIMKVDRGRTIMPNEITVSMTEHWFPAHPHLPFERSNLINYQPSLT
jgi:hypothetical protein